MDSENTESSTATSSFSSDSLKSETGKLSIYPPPPLDAAVKAAFPNRYSSLSAEKPPSAWPYRIWNAFLILLAMTGCIFPLVVFFRDPGSPQWFCYCLLIIFGGPMLLSLPVCFSSFLPLPAFSFTNGCIFRVGLATFLSVPSITSCGTCAAY